MSRKGGLTKLYLARLKKYDPLLHCVVSLTEDLAMKQAARADEELAAGYYRGPLHGIPWGAKDLLAVKGYKTTFGASPYKDQTIDADATVYTRLTEAGAVLVGKLTLGALAMGDRWFGGQTKSPWDPANPTMGSSGSSAGQRVQRMRDMRKNNVEALAVIKSLGVKLVPIEMPKFDTNPIDFVLTAEAAAAFHDLVISDRFDSMTAEPERSAWVGSMRQHELVPAVQYIQANRARYRLMESFAKVIEGVDLFIGSQLGVTNLTGHPEISLVSGFNAQGQPQSLRLTGRLFGEEDILLLAHAFQQKTDFHLRRPKL